MTPLEHIITIIFFLQILMRNTVLTSLRDTFLAKPAVSCTFQCDKNIKVIYLKSFKVKTNDSDS